MTRAPVSARQLALAACTALFGCSGAGPIPSIAGLFGPFYARSPELSDPCTLDPAPRGTATFELTSLVLDTTARHHALESLFREALGRPVRVVRRPDYCASYIADDLDTGRVDLAYVPAFAWVDGDLAEHAHPVAVARIDGRPVHRIVLYTSRESPVDSLDDLARAPDVLLAFPRFGSVGDRVYARFLLRQAGLDLTDRIGEGGDIANPDMLCRVLAGDGRRIGVGISRDPIEAPAARVAGCDHVAGLDATALKIVAATVAIPNDVLAIRANLPARDRDAVLKAIRALEADEAGRRTLAAAFGADGWADPSEVDYGPVQAVETQVRGR